MGIGTIFLQRYLKQTNLDTEEAHRRADPVDKAGLENKHEKGGLTRITFAFV